jgi:hypothetical protein
MIFVNKSRPRDNFDDDMFGWEDFTLSSAESKRLYINAQMSTALRNIGCDAGNAKLIAEAISGVVGSDEIGVDHQSHIALPRAWDGAELDIDFAQSWRDHVLRDDVVVLGGNDNSDGHPMAGSGANAGLGLGRETESPVARFDAKGNYWSLFSRGSGAKIRMSFDEKAPAPTKAFAPELIDIKITDQCHFGCTYCYQGSTPTGAHAEWDAMSSIAYALGDLRVFEAAIGGGEPTLHPKFVEFCELLRREGVVPNFTTRSLAWIKDADTFRRLNAVIGSFAFSVETGDDVRRFAAALKAKKVETNDMCHGSRRAAVQFVMGCRPMSDFEGVLAAAHKASLRLTLLGYKTTGRGCDVTPHDYSGWLDIVKALGNKHACPKIGIDTALAAQYQKQIVDAGIPAWCFHTDDGTFSMYIDAVSGRVARSSYVSSVEMIPMRVGYDTKPLLSQFEKWQAA